MTIALFASGASRCLLSYYGGLTPKVALIYNVTDMLVSSILGLILTIDAELKNCHEDLLFPVLASRTMGVIAGLCVTATMVEPIHPSYAITLNATALVIGIVARHTLSPDELAFFIL